MVMKIFPSSLSGDLGATRCVSSTPVVGRMSAAQQGIGQWQPDQPMPPHEVARASRVPHVNTLLSSFDFPGTPGEPRRQAYIARLMAMHLQAQRQSAMSALPVPASAVAVIPAQDPAPGLFWRLWHAHVIGKLAALTALMARGRLEAAPAPVASLPCLVCFEPASEANPAAKPAACAHSARFCTSCLREAVQSSETGRCPYEHCDELIQPEDALALGLGGEQAQTIARRIVQGCLSTEPEWISCPTVGCAAGAMVPIGSTKSYECQACGESAALRNLEAVTDTNRKQLKLLVKHLGSRPLKGTVRECYECGVATEHRGGCSHMMCSSGQGLPHPWDFISGPRPTTYTSSAQSFVPKMGLLVRTGIYEGLQPGSTRVLVAKVARANAVRLGVVPAGLLRRLWRGRRPTE